MQEYRRTTPTIDPDAQAVNAALDDVAAKIRVGRQLREIIDRRFDGKPRLFRDWVRRNLDCSPQSALRYLCLARHADKLAQLGPIDLVPAYRLLGIEGNLMTDDPLVWGARI